MITCRTSYILLKNCFSLGEDTILAVFVWFWFGLVLLWVFWNGSEFLSTRKEEMPVGIDVEEEQGANVGFDMHRIRLIILKSIVHTQQL